MTYFKCAFSKSIDEQNILHMVSRILGLENRGLSEHLATAVGVQRTS